MADIIELIWANFRKGGVKQVEVLHNQGDYPCLVKVTHHEDQINVVTCEEWCGRRCDMCKYEMR